MQDRKFKGCKECGRTGLILNTDKYCAECSTWRERIKMQDDSRSVIAEDGAYWIGDGKMPPYGFGGRKFVIKFTDGRVVETNDLWFTGEIPNRYKDKFAVNAEVKKVKV